MDEVLHGFLHGRSPVWSGRAGWRLGDIAVSTYLYSECPPAAFVTSARAVVLRADFVLVVRDPERWHVVRGGRMEPGESIEETALREVLEETGWDVELAGIIAFRHLHWLEPLSGPPPGPYPDFLQVIFGARALQHRPEARELEGYETGAEFRPIDGLSGLTEEDYFLIEAARQLAGKGS